FELTFDNIVDNYYKKANKGVIFLSFSLFHSLILLFFFLFSPLFLFLDVSLFLSLDSHSYFFSLRNSSTTSRAISKDAFHFLFFWISMNVPRIYATNFSILLSFFPFSLFSLLPF